MICVRLGVEIITIIKQTDPDGYKIMRKTYYVIIHDQKRWVWDIEGKEHLGLNGTSKTHWVYMAEDLPEGLIPPIDSPHWEPLSIAINRRIWDIRFKQSNTIKHKWDETDFRNHTNVEMWCNSKLVYSFGTTGTDSGLAFAFGKVQYLMVALSEHCFNFFDPEEEQGRKIFWYGLPATVIVSSHQSWEIRIKPDYTTGIDRKSWWKEYLNRKSKVTSIKDEDDEMEDDDDQEDKVSDVINWGDAFSDQHINWFRKPEELLS